MSDAPTAEVTRGGGGQRPGRLLSLDVFRGLVVAGMILVNNVSGSGLPFLRHAAWHGLSLADVVFPSFVYIIGVATALSASRSASLPRSRRVGRLLVRVGVLLALGLLINAVYSYAAGLHAVGFDGVLPRIALASLLAAPFARLGPRATAAIGLAFLALHAALLLWLPFPGGTPGDLSRPDATLPAYVDARVFHQPQHLDPENLLGTISTAGGLLLGVSAGGVLLRRRRQAFPILLGAGIALIVAGVALSPLLPVNKRLWTATFVLVTAGIDTLLLAVLRRLTDFTQPRWGRAIEPLGRNALVLYVGSTLLAGMLLAVHVPPPSLYASLLIAIRSMLPEPAASVLFACGFLALWYAIAWLMYRRRIFIRL